MGYQITFVPTEDKMKEYKPWKEDQPRESNIDNYKYELIDYCMKSHDSVYQIIKQLGFYLRCIAQTVEKDEKEDAYFRWKNDENHELWYCGWEFSRPSSFDKDEVIKNHIDYLFTLTDLVATPDYFEDSEHFYQKLSEVKEHIEGFIEIIQDITIHNIIDDLKDFEKKYDEDEENE